MRTIDLQQGSAEWLAKRILLDCASEAPMVMGASAHTTRQELVRMRAIGNEKEFSDFVQRNVLDRGHEIEAAARAIVEAQLGEPLFPVFAESDDGVYGASPDGMTMDEETGWECKSLNEALWRAQQAGEVLPEHAWQMAHQFMVCGFRRILFTVSDGTPERTLTREILPDAAGIEALRKAWVQFRADVSRYQHVEVLDAPTAAKPAALPELMVALVGEVRSSNLATWRDVVGARIAAIKTDLQTDEDFAAADKMVVFLKDGEEKIKFIKAQALAQTSTIDQLFRDLDEVAAAMRAKRLDLDKLVSAKKESKRAEIVNAGKSAYTAYIAGLNDLLGAPYMPDLPTDFAGVMKGKKTIRSLMDAMNQELARAKLAANDLRDRIQLNLRTFKATAKGEEHQFPDLRQLVLKMPEDFEAFVKNRMAENKAVADRRAAEEQARVAAAQQAAADALAAQQAAQDAIAAAGARAAGAGVQMGTAAPGVAPATDLLSGQGTAVAAVPVQSSVAAPLGKVSNPQAMLRDLLTYDRAIELWQVDARTYTLKVL